MESTASVKSANPPANNPNLVHLARLISESRAITPSMFHPESISDKVKAMESCISSMRDEILDMKKMKESECKDRDEKKKKKKRKKNMSDEDSEPEEKKKKKQKRRVDEDSEPEDKKKKKKKRRKRKRERSPSDEDSEQEDEYEKSEPKRVTDLPVDLLVRIFAYLPLRDIVRCRIYLVCSAFKLAFDSTGMWNHQILVHFGGTGANTSPWTAYATSETKGIYMLTHRARSPLYEVGDRWISAKEKFMRSLRKLEKQFVVSRLTDSCIKSFNMIPCVMIDPELGMQDSHLPRSRFSKKVLLGSRLENGTLPLTILYVVINRTRANRSNFEAKVVCVDKRFESPATKKMHRNDVFEGIMRMLSQARSSLAFNAPYWDPTDVSKDHHDGKKITEMKKCLEKYDPESDGPIKKHNKDEDVKKLTGALSNTYMFRPYSGCPPISDSANKSGYVIVNRGTFSDVAYIFGNDNIKKVNGEYFRDGSLWSDEKAWYWPATRFILGYKCQISSNALYHPEVLLENCLHPKKDNMSPVIMDRESLSLDLQIIHHIMQTRLNRISS